MQQMTQEQMQQMMQQMQQMMQQGLKNLVEKVKKIPDLAKQYNIPISDMYVIYNLLSINQEIKNAQAAIDTHVLATIDIRALEQLKTELSSLLGDDCNKAFTAVIKKFEDALLPELGDDMFTTTSLEKIAEHVKTNSVCVNNNIKRAYELQFANNLMFAKV